MWENHKAQILKQVLIGAKLQQTKNYTNNQTMWSLSPEWTHNKFLISKVDSISFFWLVAIKNIIYISGNY